MSAKARAEKDAMQRSRDALDGRSTHIRIGRDFDNQRNPGEVTFIGHAHELHGPTGSCTCCYGRNT